MQRVIVIVCLMSLSLAVSGNVDKPNVVELYMIADPQIMKNYHNLGYKKAELLSDIYIVVNEANHLLKTLLPYGINLQFQVNGLDFLTDNEWKYVDKPAFNKKGISVGDVWFQTINYYERKKREMASFDVAVLLTGHPKLWAHGDSVEGYKFGDGRTVCSYKLPLVGVKFHGIHYTSLILVHEFIHTLGIGHDGYHYYESYIQSEVPTAYSLNRFNFSKRTAEDVVRIIKDMNVNDVNCLSDSKTSTVKSPYGNIVINYYNMFDKKKVCQKFLMSKDALHCEEDSYTDTYNMDSLPAKFDFHCFVILCKEKLSQKNCVETMTSEGTPCGTNRVCNKGQCVKWEDP